MTFGGNRRVLNNGTWAGFGFQRSGPVDHSLPVLVARDEQGTVKVVWANYACHCTTVGSRNRVGGDWAGFANTWIEKQYPEAVSLMTIGCGADVGPQPSGNLDIAQKHGRAVAEEVRRLLAKPARPLHAAPQVSVRQVKLPLAELPPREYWDKQARRGGFYGQLAVAMLARLNERGEIPTHVDYPLSVWTFDDDLVMVFLAGEVVVDYSVRLNRRLDWSRLWITAWDNGMPGYVPSRRVLQEGGYEADRSMWYYAQPMELVDARFRASPDQKEAPFHRIPSGEQQTFERLAKWASEPKSEADDGVLRRVRELIPQAAPAVANVTRNDGRRTEWYNFAGDFTERFFIRQEKKGVELRWRVPPPSPIAGSPRIVCFLGGIGWESEPRTDGFSLLIENREVLRFDVTRQPSIWKSDDGNVELVYLPTWKSSVDSAGFFFLRVSEPIKDHATIGVRSMGSGSRRWFAVDARQDVTARLKKLATAIEEEK